MTFSPLEEPEIEHPLVSVPVMAEPLLWFIYVSLWKFREISSSYTFCSKNFTHKITNLIKSSTIFAIVFEMSLTIHVMANIDL